MWTCSECEHPNPKTQEQCEQCKAPRPADSLIGEQVSEWILHKRLGEGGMAVVFLAHHAMLDSPVAVKLLRSDVMHKRDVLERFRKEALAASHLRHENVIQVIHFGKQDGIGTYMVLEYLEGVDLESEISKAPLPTNYILGIAKQICSGLQAAHDAKIIHRDLKPSNIFLVPRGDSEIPLVKILDFGIAKIQESQFFEGEQHLTRTGTILGTPYYLSPEQLKKRASESPGASVDIYAFGVILYQMFTGHLPIEEVTLAEQMAAILTRRPQLIGKLREDLADTALELYLHRLLSKNPDERPATILEAWQELVAATGVLGQQHQDNELRQRWEEQYKPQYTGEIEVSSSLRWRWLSVILVLLLLSGIGGAWLTYELLMQKPSLPPPPPVVQRLAPLPRWQSEGVKAFDSGNYEKAIERWNKVILSKEFKRDSLHYNPDIYLSMSVAWTKLQQRYAALQILQQYAAIMPLKPDQERELQSLQNEMKVKSDFLGKFYKSFRDFLRVKNYRDAFEVYREVKKFEDRSHPDFAKTALNMARDLAILFPRSALDIYDHLEKYQMQIQSESVQKRVELEKARLQTRLQKQRKEVLQSIRQQTETAQPRQSKWIRQLRANLQKLLEHPDDVMAHRELLDFIRELLPLQPQVALRLLLEYRDLVRRLPKQAGWEQWLAPLLKHAQISVAQIEKSVPQSQKLAKALQQTQAIRNRLQNRRYHSPSADAMRFTAAKRELESLLSTWANICAESSVFQSLCERHYALNKQRLAELQQMEQLWRQITEEAGINNRFKAAEKVFRLLVEQINKQNWLEPDNAVLRQFAEWKQKHTRSQEYLERANRATNRHTWSECREAYQRYLDLFPKAHDHKDVRFKRCQCNCKQPAPFEPCDESCVVGKVRKHKPK